MNALLLSFCSLDICLEEFLAHVKQRREEAASALASLLFLLYSCLIFRTVGQETIRLCLKD